VPTGDAEVALTGISIAIGWMPAMLVHLIAVQLDPPVFILAKVHTMPTIADVKKTAVPHVKVMLIVKINASVLPIIMLAIVEVSIVDANMQRKFVTLRVAVTQLAMLLQDVV
jgi:hypothetical protein